MDMNQVWAIEKVLVAPAATLNWETVVEVKVELELEKGVGAEAGAVLRAAVMVN
jgi:hypothetical protein